MTYEYKKLKIRTDNLTEEKQTLSIFGWEIENQDIGELNSIIYLRRDIDTPYYEEVTKLEKEWNRKMSFKPLPVYILMAVTGLLLTVFLILNFFMKLVTIDSLPSIIVLVSAGATFLAGSLTFILEMMKVQKNLPQYYEKRHEFAEKIERIKHDHEVIQS